MSGRNGYFQLSIKEDGTYIKLVAQEQGGNPISYDELCNYLVEHKIYEFDKDAISVALAKLENAAVVKLCSKIISSVDEQIKILISENRMVAIGRFYPPSNQGKSITPEDIIRELHRAGVKYGIEESSIRTALENKTYGTDLILAKGKPAIEGKDSIITYHFNTDLTLKPKTNEDGSVDFHKLDMISHCKKGDVLAKRTPMIPGEPGMDVCGNAIRPPKVNNRVLRHGNKAHLSEDGLTMYSDVDGHVSLVDGRVFVEDTYEVPANVDASTGDIEYEGNILIKGNVNTGYTVRAKGNVEVLGVVEGAVIEAGGHIILRRGMQGMNKGILKAKGNIITKFLENAQVIAGGYITTESILHSKVSAKGDITVGGRRGFVTGGEIRSSSKITVKNAGSQMGTSTILEVGIDPQILEEFRNLEKELMVKEEEKEKLTQAITLLRKKANGISGLTEKQQEMLKHATKNSIILDRDLREGNKRLEELSEEVEGNTVGVIQVNDAIFPGVKLVISNVTYYVRNEIKYSKFVRDGADIRVLPIS